jgi:hypothetical protein
MMEEAINRPANTELDISPTVIDHHLAHGPEHSSVEPFRVTCETCHSRLKIRSPEVIGEIHACPKCGSMVQIVPPSGWSAGSSVVAASASSVSPLEPAISISNTIVGTEFHIDEAALAQGSAPVAVTTSVVEPRAASAEATVVPATVAGRSHLLIWGLSGAALVLVGGLAVALLLSKNSLPTASAPVATTAQTKPVVIGPSKEQNIASPESIPAEATSLAANKQPTIAESAPIASATSEVEADSPHALEPQTSTGPAPPAAGTQVAKVAEPAAVATSDPALPPETKKVTGANSTPATAAAPVLQFDPLDFDTVRLSVPASSGEAAAGSVPPELPDSHTEADDRAAPAAEAELKDVPPPALNPTVSVRVGAVPAESMKSRDDVAKLALELDAIQLNDVPLVQFLDTVSEMSGAPITLDPIALELAGVSQRALVSIDSHGAPLEKLLRDALAKNRLELVESDGRISVGLPDAKERGSVDHEVADLAAGADAAGVARLIEQFVEPATWKSGGGGEIQAIGTKLHVENTLRVRRQALLFCERLRLARGLPIRSKYPAALLSVASPYQTVSAKLNAPTTFTFLPWARFTDVIQHWQKMTGVTILVDWSALADVEIGPSTPIACSAVDRKWQEAFSGILDPLSLGWWAVSGDTIQITSRDALHKIERIEFYDVPKPMGDHFASADHLVESLAQSWREHAAADRLPDVRVVHDETSGRLIILGTPDAHRWLANRLTVSK